MASKTKTNGHNGNLATKIKRTYKADKHTLQLAAKKLTKTATNAKKKAIEIEDTVEDYAIHHPWKTMGMSLLAGVIVGKIINFRK